MPEDIIHRHPFGAAWRGLAGILAMAALLYFGWYDPNPLYQVAFSAVAIIVGLVTIVVVWVYMLAKLTLNDSGILVTNYSTLFASVEAEADWNTVQSVTVDQGGIFAKTFGYGTLLIQTADARPNLSLTNVPDPQTWAQKIDARAQLGSQVSSGN